MGLFSVTAKAETSAVIKSDRETTLELKIAELEGLLTIRGQEAEHHLNAERIKTIAANHKADEALRICNYISRVYAVDNIPNLERQSPWPLSFFKFPESNGVYYFNCSIIRWQKKLWLCARRLRSDIQEFNDIVFWELNHELHPELMVPCVLPLERPEDNYEDPRAFIHRGQLWVGSCNFRTGQYAHQCVSRLNGIFEAVEHIRPGFGKNRESLSAQQGHEKNWVWFSHNKELHFIYKTGPKHCVVRTENGKPVEEHITHKTNPLWKAGDPRGGSAPVKVGDEYFCFFHSSTPWKNLRRRYHMGAYAFQDKPPFEITRMTTLPLLTGSENDHYRIGMPPVVFPCGAIYENETWTVSLGVNDTQSAFVKIPMRDLEELMRKL